MHSWTKATASDTTNCVEMRRVGDDVLVRNSRDPEGPTLRFTPAEVRAWLAGAKGGEFDPLAD